MKNNRKYFNMKTMSPVGKGIAFLFLAVPLILIAANVGLAYESEECIGCHNLQSTKSRLAINVDSFSKSVHGEGTDCGDCHTQVEDESHTQSPGSGVVDCTQCHDQENRHGLNSTTGNRPQCSACHTRHRILPKNDPEASIHPNHLQQTCGQCHPAQSGQSGYLSWLPAIKIATHPKADLSGDFKESNCIGCHQGAAAHGEIDLISEANCHRCHLSANGQGALLGFIHPRADLNRQPAVFFVGVLYQLVMLALFGGGILFFIRKFSGTQRP
jgi:hypothetical protein